MKVFVFALLIFTSSASIAQVSNQINWMTWDEMTALRETDSVKKKDICRFLYWMVRMVQENGCYNICRPEYCSVYESKFLCSKI